MARLCIPRFRLKSLLLGVALISPCLTYVGNYVYLSRRGMAEVQDYGEGFFFYVPLERCNDPASLALHNDRTRLYAPLNWLDRMCFGGAYPFRGITSLAPDAQAR